jgi:hypothetical protein
VERRGRLMAIAAASSGLSADVLFAECGAQRDPCEIEDMRMQSRLGATGAKTSLAQPREPGRRERADAIVSLAASS